MKSFVNESRQTSGMKSAQYINENRFQGFLDPHPVTGILMNTDVKNSHNQSRGGQVAPPVLCKKFSVK